MDISVVIPIYGCKVALPELHRRLTETIKKISEDYKKKQELKRFDELWNC